MSSYAFWRSKVRQRLQDPVEAEILAPIKPPHAFGTKRPSLESCYWETFNQSNVDLIDVNSDPIVEVTDRGVITASGRLHCLDILALATGFDFLTASMLAMNIRGKNGTKLEDRWDIKQDGKGTSTYLGLSTAGFPNLLFPMGPQAPSALGLTPQLAEVQGDWVAQLLSWMAKHDKLTVEPLLEAEQSWKEEVDRAARTSLFGQTDSWYMGVNIPGRKKQPLCYFGGVNKYIDELARCAESDYKGFSFQ
ncbi:hypothetical protein M409DRAFT_38106 [Zasmidium cellare ATCC 36951]|uniref:Uncharacterized protein n=1 Tax=Zasmidium cellare ATCC 36951 TaxID=1080233 RepID=A0A6A6BVG1_ZASCE|nr:uncharacterized protein M409DRAFT_38106 [Zasmidium cellare ATCC 36951]KAF2158794.1 hypothetical protein M409DRAFT_38106 [Zasmidium cellare ATCC 36951]